MTRFFIIAWSCTHDELGGCKDVRQSFSYFTILTFWGLGFYFLVAAIHTLTYAIRGRPLLDRFPRPLQALHSLFYTTVITFPFLVTIVYWVVLYENPWFTSEFKAWSNVSQHGLNSLFALFEIFIPRTNPPLWIHIVWLVLILAGYLGIAYITVADQGFYTYNFLDHDEIGGRGIVAAYVMGILVGTIIVFCIVWGIIWVRKWLTEKKLGMEGKFAHHSRKSDTEMAVLDNGYTAGDHSETRDRAYF